MGEDLWGGSGKEGLAFFGKMSACISHEIKNCLAIIGQQAGLLDDFLLMVEQGRPLDTGRVKELAKDIARQVNRADQVVKGLNRLAHSVDDSRCLVDLDETVALIVSICKRIASVKGVCLEMNGPKSSVQVESSPFSLMYIVFFYLDKAMSGSTDEPVTVNLKDVGDAGRVTIAGAFEASNYSSGAVPAPIRILQEKLGVTVNTGGGFGGIAISVPKAFELKNSGP